MTTALILNIAFAAVVIVAIVGMLARAIVQDNGITVQTARRPQRTTAPRTAIRAAVLPKA